MPNSTERNNNNINLVDEENRNPNLAGQSRRPRRSFVEIAERAPAERQRAWLQQQRVERWVTVDIARKIGGSAQRVARQTATCHEFNVRVSRREATFEEWSSFLGDLYRKFNRFFDLRFHPTILREVENLVILGWLIYGENRLKPVLSELGIFLKIYLDENGAHNIIQLNTRISEGPLPENDPVFHFLPYRHGSLEDITQRVGLMPSIPLEIVSTMDDSICSICHDKFAQEGEGEGASSSDSAEPVTLPMRLPCNHVFHSVCITTWLALNSSCPLCRHRTFSDL